MKIGMRDSRYRTKFDVFAQVGLFMLVVHVVVKFTAFAYLQVVQRGKGLTEDLGSKVTYVSDQWSFEQRHVALQLDNNVRYGLHSSPEWSSLVPGDGHIYLGADHEPVMVSMFHQLRCIDVVRRQLAIPRRNRHAELAQHCMNYLRQMILCRGDSFLDPYQYPSRISGVDPNPIRQCWDWEVVYRATMTNQKEHARWLDGGR
jgi:hypothetical protein